MRRDCEKEEGDGEKLGRERRYGEKRKNEI